MYVPSHFEENDTGILHQLMQDHPFGLLLTHGGDGLNGDHLPFRLDREQGALGMLSAHVARANPVWQRVRDGDEVLVVFQAGDAYISPNWYPSKHETHQQVPTWNYRVIHAHGRIAVRDDERAVRAIIASLTKTHEASQPVPWKMSDSPKEYMDRMVKAIVGIEIQITRLIGKFKLSQNRETRDIQGAAHGLMQQGNTPLGQAMMDIAANRD